MKKNYYDELIEKIEDYLKKKQKNEAIILIKEELALPYVPKEYEIKLIHYLEQLDEKKEKKKSIFSREEVLTIINEFEKHDLNFLIDISSTFEEYNWKGYEKEIEEIFNIKNLDNKVKSMIYNNLVIQDMNYNFKINNLIINPHKNKTMFETQYAIRNLVKLSEIENKNPSIFSICERIFFIYLMNLFPESLFFKYEDISNEIINIANVMIGDKKVNSLEKKEKEIYKIINGNN